MRQSVAIVYFTEDRRIKTRAFYRRGLLDVLSIVVLLL